MKMCFDCTSLMFTKRIMRRRGSVIQAMENVRLGETHNETLVASACSCCLGTSPEHWGALAWSNDV